MGLVLTDFVVYARDASASEDDGPSSVDDCLGGLVNVECFDRASEGFLIGEWEMAEVSWVSDRLSIK